MLTHPPLCTQAEPADLPRTHRLSCSAPSQGSTEFLKVNCKVSVVALGSSISFFKIHNSSLSLLSLSLFHSLNTSGCSGLLSSRRALAPYVVQTRYEHSFCCCCWEAA